MLESTGMIVLASNSPRRKELMTLAGWDFLVMPADIDEVVLPGELPVGYVLRLSQAKAAEITARAPAGAVVLAADTTVVDGEEILGKPTTPDQAADILLRLRGRPHQVYTGLTVARTQDGKVLSEACLTQVNMRSYTDAEIQAYIDSGDPMDKAGAYAIQHTGFHPVESLQGCYTNVMGLPLCRVVQLLTQLGFPPPARPPYPCLYTPNIDRCSFTPPDLV